MLSITRAILRANLPTRTCDDKYRCQDASAPLPSSCIKSISLFLDKNKRISINVSVIAFSDTPPLAFFQSNGDVGPYTITSDAMQRKLGTEISVVSLPHSYKQHPIIWASLTHGVCGHDVCHADPELIPELVTGIRSLFKTSDFPRDSIPKRDVLNAMLWSYWIDEAVADVYGLLNMGPTFPFNLAALLSAMTYRSHLDAGRRGPPLTALQTNSRSERPKSQRLQVGRPIRQKYSDSTWPSALLKVCRAYQSQQKISI